MQVREGLRWKQSRIRLPVCFGHVKHIGDDILVIILLLRWLVVTDAEGITRVSVMFLASCIKFCT